MLAESLEDELVEAVEEPLALVRAAIRFCSRLSMEVDELVLELSEDDELSTLSAW